MCILLTHCAASENKFEQHDLAVTIWLSLSIACQGVDASTKYCCSAIDACRRRPCHIRAVPYPLAKRVIRPQELLVHTLHYRKLVFRGGSILSSYQTPLRASCGSATLECRHKAPRSRTNLRQVFSKDTRALPPLLLLHTTMGHIKGYITEKLFPPLARPIRPSMYVIAAVSSVSPSLPPSTSLAPTTPSQLAYRSPRQRKQRRTEPAWWVLLQIVVHSSVHSDLHSIDREFSEGANQQRPVWTLSAQQPLAGPPRSMPLPE